MRDNEGTVRRVFTIEGYMSDLVSLVLGSCTSQTVLRRFRNLTRTVTFTNKDGSVPLRDVSKLMAVHCLEAKCSGLLFGGVC
jgi:hypothetical protein